MTTDTPRSLSKKIRAELESANREVGGDPSAAYYLERNNYAVAYQKLRRFRGGSEKFYKHMKCAAALMTPKKEPTDAI